MIRGRGVAVLTGLAVVVAAAGAIFVFGRDSTSRGVGESVPRTAVSRDTAAMAPVGVRVRVRVLNGAGAAGLARRGTQYLRDFGYDVVEYGNAGGATVSGSSIEVSPGGEDIGARLVRALGTGSVQVAAGPLAFVDAIVVLGTDWQPPAEPFRP